MAKPVLTYHLGQPAPAAPATRLARIGQFVADVIARFSEPAVLSAPPVITYYMLLSVFPLVIVIGNLLPVVGITPQFALSYLAPIVPASLMKTFQPAVIALLRDRNGGLLSFGIIATLWTASRGFNAMRNSMNYAYGVPRATSTRQGIIMYFGRRLLSFLLTLAFILVLGVLMLLFIFGGQFLEWLIPLLQLPDSWLATYRTLRWPVAVGATLVLGMLFYFFLPNARMRWWTVLPGTAVMTVGSILLAQGFSIYMRYFGTGWNSYGRIGTVMIMLLWINWTATIFVFGAVVNAVTQETAHGTAPTSGSRFVDWLRRRREKREKA
ncbi:YihY/virulence factor BrkB family protein [Schleiferilactobacillus shenzhenensis]|uniref:YihY n=1 Tax=Schleiferilactobacillus shenzhenensis LY-73 TaxID=1231336 RepID=U4TXN0_9LACO|nr:YihY/virulence factor BrkB family protein [Schleiferilactobacillus shenzhenensis]ERL66107.1 hypothetical protein L248_1199 [Schleiferilactobacillus shenzhenensis LY-73]